MAESEDDDRHMYNGTGNGQTEASQETSPVTLVKVSSYEEGLINGVIEAEKQPFLDFLGNSGDHESAVEQLNDLNKKIQAKKEEIRQTKEQWIELKRKQKENEESEALQQERIDYLKKKADSWSKETAGLQETVSSLKLEFPIVPSLLFLVAAFVFIISDVIFTQSVVAYLFNMKEWEGWLIAAGLACITFLIKPLIDRTIEHPYKDKLHVKRVYVFYLIVSIAAIVMLGVLGYLRLEGVSFVNENNASSISTAVTEGDLSQVGNNETSTQKKIIPKEVLYSWYSTTLFVLSSILFALAGAIGLSISLPNLGAAGRKIRKKAWVPIIKNQLQKNQEKVDSLRVTQNQFRVEKEDALNRIALLRPIPELQQELLTMEQSITGLKEQIFKSQTLAEQSWYGEGYNRGSKFRLNGELTFTPFQILRSILRGFFWTSGKPRSYGNPPRRPSSEHSQNGAPVSKESGYLHQELRRMIDYTFTKNQQNLFNGKE